ncbi:interleukin-36 beta [Octodon degus]|uniref:Interleukin-1 n=1 Tax=Octodon degus TaxID=10160 RepID=A0A6P3FAV8_OCTDE|nr:interleukin-36 beta [Octodon degus]
MVRGTGETLKGKKAEYQEPIEKVASRTGLCLGEEGLHLLLFSSAAELELLALEKLKYSLAALALKRGSMLQELTARFFSVRRLGSKLVPLSRNPDVLGLWKNLMRLEIAMYRIFRAASLFGDVGHRQIFFRDTPTYYDIRDSQQMVWILRGNVLITAPSSNNVEPVILALIPCRHSELSNKEKGNLVYLGIKDKNFSLFCTETEGKPTLQLKEKKIMDLYWDPTPQKSFLFFHNMEGSTSAFESVSYPGWFIATSSESSQPIFLTQERGLTNSTNFYLNPKNSQSEL